MKTVLISGGTGMIGTALTNSLVEKGYKVVILTRSEKDRSLNEHVTYAAWHPSKNKIDEAAVSRADYIINLAGANIGAKRWTEKRKKEILESRTKSADTIVQALANTENNVKAVVSASAMGWYGGSSNRSADVPLTEDLPPADDFLGRTCQAWEASIAPVKDMGKRLVIYRCGLVLSKKGGAYEEFRKPLNYHVAPVLGNGKQIYSWLHIQDMVRLYIHAMEHEEMNGVYNAVSPQPVSNKELMKTIVEVTGKKALMMPVPAFALKIALGEMSIEVLKSAIVDSSKLLKTGYQFLYPDVKSAIRQLEEV